MKVGVVSTNNIPYVIREGDKYSGISIEIWETIAKKANIDFTYVEAGTSQEDSVLKLMNGEVDILVGPYTITDKRYQHVDFTIPYYISDIGLATSKKTNNLENYIKISKVFASIISLFLLVLFLNNFVNKFNPKKGFADLVMNCIPDFKDRKMWFLYTIIFCSVIVFYINAFQPNINLGTNNINIKNKSVSYSNDPYVKKIISKSKAKGVFVEPDNTSDHQKQLQDNKLFNHYINNSDNLYGMISDTSKMAYILHHNIKKYDNINVVKKNLANFTYGFVLPKKSDHKEKINVALREAQSEKINQIIIKKYLGPKFENYVSF